MVARKRIIRSLPAWAALVIAVAVEGQCRNLTAALDSMAPATIEIRNERAEIVELEVRVANNMTERAGGFQHLCPEVIRTTAILFVYMEPRLGRFHMRNVYAPLDIAFIADDGRIVEIQRMEAEPPGLPVIPRTYGPARAFRFALEARAGFFASNDIGVGVSLFDATGFSAAPRIGPSTRGAQ